MLRCQLVLYLFTAALLHGARGLNSVWRWECIEGSCHKRAITPDTEETALSLPACRIFCSEAAALWPKPTGTVDVGSYLVRINPNSVDVLGNKFGSGAHTAASGAIRIFKKLIAESIPKRAKLADGGKTLEVTLVIANPDIAKLDLDTDESYILRVAETADGLRMNATIEAPTYFGGRHGLETLNQLIIFDDLRDELQMPREVLIEDKPAYPHRGILLDTSRNYVSVEAIKRTIDAMGASKLNSFHWHITDSHSFPFVAESRPELSKFGAYSPKKIYTPEDVGDIVAFGLERGVRVIPEFDAPAHVGEGWQNTDLVTCFNKKPWQDYCVEPPCGQFDPTKPDLYNVLEDIYGDMLKQFDPVIFHMGGDEVHFGCWNSTENIVQWMQTQGWGRSEEDFVKLWDQFQSQALNRLYRKAGREIPVIMWTSTLTQKEYVLKYLPKDKYIIQIWTTGQDPQVPYLLENDYRLIISNYDALYFDCGFSGWVTDGNNWCSPYIGWQKVYENSPAKIAGARKGQVLGAEATLWTEQADSAVVDSRLWPRAAAMGEVLWSEPQTGWRDAESRILVHRERLVERGIDSDALEPEWCRQYQEHCPINELDHHDGTINETATFILIIVNVLLSIVISL